MISGLTVSTRKVKQRKGLICQKRSIYAERQKSDTDYSILMIWGQGNACFVLWRTSFMDYQPTTAQKAPLKTLMGFRTPKRITTTVSYKTYERLISRSDEEGRSLSNLAAFLLESGVVASERPIPRTPE